MRCCVSRGIGHDHVAAFPGQRPRRGLVDVAEENALHAALEHGDAAPPRRALGGDVRGQPAGQAAQLRGRLQLFDRAQPSGQSLAQPAAVQQRMLGEHTEDGGGAQPARRDCPQLAVAPQLVATPLLPSAPEFDRSLPR
jgi:hypothetical protein